MDVMIQFAYVVSAALFIFGLKQLGSPDTARRPTNQKARHTAKAVKQCDHFRHGRHLHHARCRAADNTTHDEADHDPLKLDNALIQ